MSDDDDLLAGWDGDFSDMHGRASESGTQATRPPPSRQQQPARKQSRRRSLSMTSNHREMVDMLLRKESLKSPTSNLRSLAIKPGTRGASDILGTQRPKQKPANQRRRANSLHAVGRTYIMEALSFFEGRERGSARICLDQTICLRKANVITDVGAELLVQELVDRNNVESYKTMITFPYHSLA